MKQTNASIGFIFITIFVDVLGLGIIIPIVPELIQELTGRPVNDASELGAYLMFSFAFTQFLFAPLMGELSDRFGRRKVLLFTLAGLGLDYLFHAIAPTIALLFVGRVLAGITGSSFTVANAYIADISTSKDRAKNFGMVGAAFGLGFTVGPVIGGVTGHYLGVRAPFIVAGILTLLNVIYGFFVLPESLPKEKRRAVVFKNMNPLTVFSRLVKFPQLKSLMIILFLVYLGQHAVHSTWSYYTMLKFDWDTDMVGYSLGAAGILVSLVQGMLVGKVVDRWGSMKTIVIGLTCWVLGLSLFGSAGEGYLMFVYLIPFCLGGVAGPAIQSYATSFVSDSQQGALQGALTSVQSLTNILGPLLMLRFLFHEFTTSDVHIPGMPFYAGGFLVFIGLIIFLRIKK